MDTSEASLPSVSAQDNDEEKEELRMPPPPKDWEFNDLLIDIANEMTKEEFEETKARFRGEDALGRRLLEKIQTPVELFDSLQKHLFLDRNNLIYLQAIVYKLGRMDLFDRAVEYAQSIGDVIHFSSPPKEPTNGYCYVQFHIDGTDFRKYKRSSLEATRMTAARLMVVPPEFVIIAGIEPSSSLIITLMIPTRFTKYLEAASRKKEAVKELTDLGIDIVRINEANINLHGVEGADVVETEAQTKLKTIYEQLQATKEILEDREIECLELQRRLRAKNNRDDFNEQTVKQPSTRHLQDTVPKLSKLSALANFRFCLKKVQQLNYNEDVIGMLLDAQTYITSIRIQHTQDIRFLALLLENKSLKEHLFQLQLLNTKLQIQNSLDNQEFQRRLYNSLLSSLSGKILGVVDFNPFATLVLKELSERLNRKEKQSLINAYNWPEEAELTKYIKREDSVVLAGLYCKEVEMNEGIMIDFDEFIMRKLTEIKRKDLQEMFIQMKRNPTCNTPSQESAGINRPQQVRSSKYPAKSRRYRTNNRSSTPPRPPTKTLNQQVELLLRKVENIEGMIQEARAYKSTLGADVFQTNPSSQGIKSDPRILFGTHGSPNNTYIKQTC